MTAWTIRPKNPNGNAVFDSIRHLRALASLFKAMMVPPDRVWPAFLFIHEVVGRIVFSDERFPPNWKP